MSARLEAALAELAEAIRAEVAAAAAPEPAPPDRLLSIEEACRALGISRTSLYAEMQAGRLRSLSVRRRRLIPASALATYTDGRA